MVVKRLRGRRAPADPPLNLVVSRLAGEGPLAALAEAL